MVHILHSVMRVHSDDHKQVKQKEPSAAARVLASGVVLLSAACGQAKCTNKRATNRMHLCPIYCNECKALMPMARQGFGEGTSPS